MSVSGPFQLTEEDVSRAALNTADIGLWCIVVKGCYHLFNSEHQARFAHAKFVAGEMVR